MKAKEEIPALTEWSGKNHTVRADNKEKHKKGTGPLKLQHTHRSLGSRLLLEPEAVDRQEPPDSS